MNLTKTEIETRIATLQESIRDMQSQVLNLQGLLSAIREYTHDFDFVFSVVTDSRSPEIHGKHLREALLKRLEGLTDMELEEACGWVHTEEGDLT